MSIKTTGWFCALGLGLALAGCSSESTDWNSATAADTSEAYQQYLQQHPTGANAAQAKTHLQQLQEDHDWQGASSADTRAAYEQFLTSHPDGKWAQEARIRIENFAQGGTTGTPTPTSTPTPAPASAASALPAPAPSGPPSAPAASAPKATLARKSAPVSRVASAAAPAHARTAGLRSTGAHSPHLAHHLAHHLVQLGAFSSQARAESRWRALQAKFPTELKAMEPRYVAARAKASHIVRLQVGLPSAERAKDLCVELRKHSQPCIAIAA